MLLRLINLFDSYFYKKRMVDIEKYMSQAKSIYDVDRLQRKLERNKGLLND